MVLVILTDRRPVEAIDSILRRLAGVATIRIFKYFPTLGGNSTRAEKYATGVGQQRIPACCMDLWHLFFVEISLKYKKKFNGTGSIADLILWS